MLEDPNAEIDIDPLDEQIEIDSEIRQVMDRALRTNVG